MIRPVKTMSPEDREDLTHVGTQQVAQKLAEVVEDGLSYAHHVDNVGEIVIGQNHLGRVLDHLGSRDAHGRADVCGLDRRGVVHPVAGHSHDVLLPSETIDDFELVLRNHSGVDGHLGGGPVQLLLVRLVQVITHAGRFAGPDDVQVGDHDRVNASLMNLIHSVPEPGARRVDDSHHSRSKSA